MSAQPKSAYLESVPKPEELTGWFVLRLNGMKFQGPTTLDAFKTAIENGKLSWMDYAYHPDFFQGWGRLYEIKNLVKLFPVGPDPAALKNYENLVKSKHEGDMKWRGAGPQPQGTKNSNWYLFLSERARLVPRDERLSKKFWYLLLDGREVGPVQLADVENALKAGPPPVSLFAWNPSIKRWRPIDGVPDLAKIMGLPHKTYSDDQTLIVEHGAQRRKSSRRTIVASVHAITPEGAVKMIGICGNVSPSGFQLLQFGDINRYEEGARGVFEIRASKTSDVVPFKVAAVVKRYDPEKHTVGFEFEKIDPVDLKLLSLFISKSS